MVAVTLQSSGSSVECACGHLERLTPATLATAGVGPDKKVLDLKAKLKCQECRWKVGLSYR
jgi:hypothetical protein